MSQKDDNGSKVLPIRPVADRGVLISRVANILVDGGVRVSQTTCIFLAACEEQYPGFTENIVKKGVFTRGRSPSETTRRESQHPTENG